MERAKKLTNNNSNNQAFELESEKIALKRAKMSDKAENLSEAHVHSEESLRQIINRLSRIEGHIRGVKTMINESRPCPQVLIQIAAIRGALDKVARIILDEHLSECIARAAREGNVEAEIEQLKAALDRFL